MKELFLRTFGGLSRSYLIRQYIFGTAIGVFFLMLYAKADGPANAFFPIYIVMNTILYPYSRYAYESVIGYLIGDNVFYCNAIIMLFVKFFTISLCFSFAMFVAPVGLAFIFFSQQRKEH